MHCPFCRCSDTRVIDSRSTEDGAAIRRRRQCPQCSRRFTTIEAMSLVVVKRSGVLEPFSREKVISGVRKACQGRPVTDDDLALLGQQVEEELRSAGQPELASHEVGLAILGPLRQLDEVAYLRFASVYRSFDSLADFEAEIGALRTSQPRSPYSVGAGREHPQLPSPTEVPGESLPDVATGPLHSELTLDLTAGRRQHSRPAAGGQPGTRVAPQPMNRTEQERP